ncbi:aminoglycoside phosphotransferase family protein [Exiguobacterium flavidum]|uniref:aminoglycoside phosphotransferase family protein n=1 Tax=Exiguobacterium flavidum TaxID=2184695 RepID=UPI000DF771C9|nr:aminoglycoside phosphotransferase family protein [Exiguobacterium flavidum]
MEARWQNKQYRRRLEDWATAETEEDLSFEVLKNTDMSFLLRGRSKDRTYFVKAVNEAAAFEAALTELIAQGFPGETVDLIAVNRRENWLLMHELPGVLLREAPDREHYQACLRHYADFQRRTIPLVPELLASGVPDRRMPVVRQEIANHLESLCATGLEADETEAILALKEELLQMCDEMEGSLPDAIDHGDLHSGNIYIDHGRCRLFDWGDASVTHPFLSTRVFWNSLFELLEDDTEENWMHEIERFRPIYLEAWKGYASDATLARQLLLAEQIGCVYRALSWHLYITPHRADRKESYDKPAQWLRLLLDHRKLLKEEP